MTHEELLAKFDDLDIAISNGFGKADAIIGCINATRAVVELHKPYTMESSDGEVIGCSCIPELPAFLNPYPCLTIQAIEEHLNG
jgi:hypothetical protein